MTEVTCPRCQSACRPYGRKYDPMGKLPVRFRCIDCQAVVNANAQVLANQLPWQKVVMLKRLLMMGQSHRAIAVALGIGKATTVRYAKLWRATADCACGKPSGHRGWCAARLQYSPVRSKWLADHWHARSDSAIQALCSEAAALALTKRHTLGPFMWGSASASSLALALCTVCGKMAQINHAGSIHGRFHGNAFRDECLTPEQKAAVAAEKQEQREWRKAKRVVKDIQAHLRAPHWPTKASALEPTSSR